jgi:hypothetical protein
MMFHVEQTKIKTLFRKGFLVFLMTMLFTACGTTRHSVEIHDYVLVPNGKQILGKEKGLTAFIFENNPRKIPFVQFVAQKYGVGQYTDVSYWVTVEDYKFKVFVYTTDELQKYFDMGQFMVTNQETTQNIVGSTEKFIGLSMTTDANEDCLDEHSLFNKIAINYLKSLKDEYNNL